MDLVYDLNAAVNIAASGLVLYSSITIYRAHLLPKFLMVLFWIICLGWISLYIFVLFEDPLHVNSVLIGRILIRPLITLTLGTIAATFIYRSKRRKVQ